MRANRRRLGVTALAVTIGAVFVYAGAAKIRATEAFADNIASFRLLPDVLTNGLAMSLPIFEILLGGLLMAGWRRRATAFCAMLVCGVFLAALLSAWARGIPVDCGCFGSEGGNLSPQGQLWLSFGRDLLLVGAAAIVYLDGRKNETAVSPAPEG